MRLKTAACWAIGSLLCTASAAQAEDRRILIMNRSSQPIYYIYGSNSGRTDWEEDLLGDSVLMPGKERIANFDDGTGSCVFDLKAKLKNGVTATRYRVNVCEKRGWVIYDKSNTIED